MAAPIHKRRGKQEWYRRAAKALSLERGKAFLFLSRRAGFLPKQSGGWDEHSHADWKEDEPLILKGAEIITQVLIEEGVDTVFGYPGGSVLDLYDALYMHRDQITHYITAHEQGASHAADGYARATGKTGVVISTSGPGATNLVTGIATAYMDSVPLVALTGNVSTGLIGRDSFQEVFITGITMPITKHNFIVRRVEDLADTLRKAFAIAQEGRKGPVLVDLPKDVMQNSCEFTPKTPVAPKLHEAEESAVAAAANRSARSCTSAAACSSPARAKSCARSSKRPTSPPATP